MLRAATILDIRREEILDWLVRGSGSTRVTGSIGGSERLTPKSYAGLKPCGSPELSLTKQVGLDRLLNCGRSGALLASAVRSFTSDTDRL